MPGQMYSNIPQQPFCGSSVYAHRVSRAHREAGSMAASSASAGSATEQSDAPMETDATHPLIGKLPHVLTNAHTHLLQVFAWEIHVEFNKGMWWAMPHDLSDPILDEWKKGAQEVSYVWDIRRYIIDFDSMQQRNIDNDRRRTVKVVAVLR